ncbi:hypothetical protein Gorai_015774 [Gossypium raimondii]|uniref:Auxin-responsive protein n=1 Tax=Gossypium raimondii TaxID=29730 RepID=A0A7J8P6U9_GOSRA|nr:hypothetical protein [Gossypium raimondii]
MKVLMMDDRGGGGSKVAGIRQIESCTSPKPSTDVPKGYLAVSVGSELRRFIIPTSYLTHPVFKILLEKAEEEFRYNHNGGPTHPCEIETFKSGWRAVSKGHNFASACEQNAPMMEQQHALSRGCGMAISS